MVLVILDYQNQLLANIYVFKFITGHVMRSKQKLNKNVDPDSTFPGKVITPQETTSWLCCFVVYNELVT